MENNIKYEKSTSKSFDQAVESVVNSLSEQNFGVLWKLNFKDKLKEKGIDFDKNFMILEVCNPKQASVVLSAHIDVGYFLPCKVVVYESGSDVRIGMMNADMLIGMLGYEDLKETAEQVQQILKTAIDNAV